MKQEQENIRKEHLEGIEDPWKLQSDNRWKIQKKVCKIYFSNSPWRQENTKKNNSKEKENSREKTSMLKDLPRRSKSK